MTDLVSSRSPESSLSSNQQQILLPQVEGSKDLIPNSPQQPPSPFSSPSSPLPHRTYVYPVSLSVKYLQRLNQTIRAESEFASLIPASFSASQSLPPLSTVSSSSTSSAGPVIGSRVSAAINSLYQASLDSSSSLISMPRNNMPRRHHPHVVNVLNHRIQGSSTNNRQRLAEEDQGFAEEILSSLSDLMASPSPQPHPQQQQYNQQKLTTMIKTTTRTIPPQSTTLNTATRTTTVPLDSSPSPSNATPSSLTTPPLPLSSSCSTFTSINSPVPVPSSAVSYSTSIAPEKIKNASFVTTTTMEEKQQQQQKQQVAQKDQQFLCTKVDKKEEREVTKEVKERKRDVKGENERKESDDNRINNTNTTTIMSLCGSTSTSATMPAANAEHTHIGCIIPPAGRDNLHYRSLNIATMDSEGTLLSISEIDNKLRPTSSMENAESAIPACQSTTTTSTDTIDSSMTYTTPNSRRSSTADSSFLDQTQLQMPTLYHQSPFRRSSLIMVTDQSRAATVTSSDICHNINNGAMANGGSRLSSDQQSVHPLQFDPEPRLSFDNCARPSAQISPRPTPFASMTSTGESWLSLPPSSSISSSSSDFSQTNSTSFNIPTLSQDNTLHKAVRKKSSLASKIRKVFIKPIGGNGSNNSNSNGSTSGRGSFSSSKEQDVDINGINHYGSSQALEDIVSMSSREGEYDNQGYHPLQNGGRIGDLSSPGSSHLIEHRGSVSSASSGESMSAGHGGFSPSTPSTSPEISPSGSPKAKHALAPLITGSSAATMVGENGRLPDGHPLSPVEINDNHLAAAAAAAASASVPPAPSTFAFNKSLEKRMSLEPTSSRTSRKRLSFASITSFFNPRNADAATAGSKKKQQRSSSVPNVESSLAGIGGRQNQDGLAMFQRRHSLNDLEITPQMQAKFAAPPWDKSRASAQTAAAEVLANNSNSIKLPAILSKASESESVSSTSTKMSKIQGVFGKQIKKNKNKKSVSETVPSTTTVSSPKPLRSALVQRPMRTPSVRKVQVNGHQQQGSVSSRRIQQNEPLVNLSQDQGIASNAGSRRNSEEQSRTGPTRHRRQSSIASRQASQQGHYSPADRKQRLSLRHSSSEEYDIILHSDLYTLDSHQQQPQLQYHGGYIQYDNIAAPQTPRVNPVSTKSSSPQINDPLASISPRTSRGAAADGSFTFSPFRRRESYPSCSSRDTSPKLGAVSTPKQQQHNHTNTIASHPHRRSSYDATTSVSRRSSYETNYRRNSMIVTSSSPSVITSPVARLSVDHTFMSDHSSPSSPTLPYPQTTIPILSPHNHHALFANYQQQQQLQLQQQQQQQQQFQRQPPMQVVPDHHYQQHHHQQFMNTHAGPQVYHEQYHQPTKQQPLYQYPAYAYQYNMPQPLPSHLYYPSTQHPTLSYAGVSMSPPPPPPPPLQYSISKPSSSVSGPGGISSGGSGSNNPSPTSWSSVSPSPSPSTPTRGNRQLHFSTAQPIIHETWTPDQYDRTSDPNITAHRLTPAIAQKIKHELNTFKSQEMMVHQESRMNTHFFT